jgi:hypothetical protein
MHSSIEYRLNALEYVLGINPNHREAQEASRYVETQDGAIAAHDPTRNLNKLNLETRIDTLLDSCNSLYKDSSHLHVELDDINILAQDLSPTGILLHSVNLAGSSSLGGTYRKHEILARYDELTMTFELLDKMRDLVIFSNPSLARKLQQMKNAESAGIIQGLIDDIVTAPIISSTSYSFAADPVNRKRLSDLTSEVLKLREKSLCLSKQLDNIIDDYYSVMIALNEKMAILRDDFNREKKG